MATHSSEKIWTGVSHLFSLLIMRRCPTKLLVPHKRAINFFAKFERYILDYHRTKLDSISLFVTRISELLYEIFLQGGARCGILVTFTRTGKVIDKSTMFRAEKRAAQLSFFSVLAGSKNSASCKQLQWLERVADRNKVREDVSRLIYL